VTFFTKLDHLLDNVPAVGSTIDIVAKKDQLVIRLRIDGFDQCSQRFGASVNVTNRITSHGSRPAKADGNSLIGESA
jgi:hypothetical protein